MIQTQSDVLAPIRTTWLEIAHSCSLALIGAMQAERVYAASDCEAAQFEIRVAIGEASLAWLRATGLRAYGFRWSAVVNDLRLGCHAMVTSFDLQRESYRRRRRPAEKQSRSERDVATRIALNLTNALATAREIYGERHGDPMELAEIFNADVQAMHANGSL
jgi:hypothetical protein